MVVPVGPYSAVVKHGDLLFTAGQIGQVDGAIVSDNFVIQTKQALENLSDVLALEHAKLSDVIKCTIYLTDMAQFAAMNEVYLEAFGDHKPARSTVAVVALPLGASFEIEAIARSK